MPAYSASVVIFLSSVHTPGLLRKGSMLYMYIHVRIIRWCAVPASGGLLGAVSLYSAHFLWIQHCFSRFGPPNFSTVRALERCQVMSPLYICVYAFYDYVHMVLVLVYYYHWDDNSVASWHKTNMLPLPHSLSIPQTLMWMWIVCCTPGGILITL